jgi:transglutaminase-like putative cysteine protease
MAKRRIPNKNAQTIGKIIAYLIITLIVLGILFGFGYLLYLGYHGFKDVTKQDIKKYTSKVEFNNEDFRTLAKQISSGCNGSQECQLTKIYFYVTTNFEYYSDQRSFENIQTPKETWESKGGDCEDLGILLQTLLESIGIKTYSVFTNNHYYVLGCIQNSRAVTELANKIYYQNYNIYYTESFYHLINNLECVPLDPTEGKYGFPGNIKWSYSEAYDPLTLNKIILN